MHSRFLVFAVTALALPLAAPGARAADETSRPVQLLVKAAGDSCTATLLPDRTPLGDVVPDTDLYQKDSSNLDDVEFSRTCEVRVAKATFNKRFGHCALAGTTGFCWMSAHYRGGRDLYFAASGPGPVQACLYTCSGR